jgi:cellulase/cellobiase CelA1
VTTPAGGGATTPGQPTDTPTPTGTPTTTPTDPGGPLVCTAGSPGIDVSFDVTDSWSTGFNARVTVDNTGADTVTSWTVTFTGLTGYVSWTTGGLFLDADAMFVGDGEIASGEAAAIDFGIQDADAMPTGCVATVTR